MRGTHTHLSTRQRHGEDVHEHDLWPASRAASEPPRRRGSVRESGGGPVRNWADRVARLAGALKALGVGKGDRVAVLSLNQDRYVELYLGVAWAGAVIVPLNIRWSAPRERGRRCATVGPSCSWSTRHSRRLGAELAQTIGSIRLVYADDAPDRSCRTAPRITRPSWPPLRRSRTPRRPKRISPAYSTRAERPADRKA